MTEKNLLEIINKVYGYEIIGDSEKETLQKSMGVILSELGIETLYEFLSYDTAEFSDARKTIHVRRFYQLFKDVFSFGGFNLEAFHKIQAGCLYTALTSGIMRGYGNYDYSGFVKEVLDTMGNFDSDGLHMYTAKDYILAIKNMFEKFSRISVGIYSLQIFTKFGMAMEKLNKYTEGYAKRLLLEIISLIDNEKNPVPKIKKLVSLGIPDADKIDSVINEYIDYAVADVLEGGIPPGREKRNRAFVKIIGEIRNDADNAFSAYRRDAENAKMLGKSIMDKIPLYENNPNDDGRLMLFLALLERFVYAFENLKYYEEIHFVKRLNMIFINKVRDIFEAQRNDEIRGIRDECIRIIENRIPGLIVYELDGVLSGLAMNKKQFDEQYGINPDDSVKAVRELDSYLSANLETAGNIQNEMRNNLKKILNPELMAESETEMLESVIYNFSSIVEFMLEEEEK